MSGRIAFVFAVAGVASCALTTSLDDLRGADDAALDAAADVASFDAPPAPDVAEAAPPARCDASAPFATPTLLASVDGGVDTASDEYGGRLSDDELTLFFSRTTGSVTQLLQATRPTPTDAFGAGVVLANVNGGTSQTDAYLMSDDLTLYFAQVSGQAPYATAYIVVSTRVSTTSPFGTPAPVLQLGEFVGDETFLADESKVYFANLTTPHLYVATNQQGSFGVPALVPGLEKIAARHPVIAPDDLTIYYAAKVSGQGDDVWTATRASPTAAFGAPVRATVLNSSADDHPTWMSRDRCILLLESARAGKFDLYVARRPL